MMWRTERDSGRLGMDVSLDDMFAPGVYWVALSNPKLQAPNPNHAQIPTPKSDSQFPNANPRPSRRWVGIWHLGFTWDLGVGSGWDLELGAWDLTPLIHQAAPEPQASARRPS